MLQGKLLDGRRALVTGASSGIGHAVACAFAGHGANVVVNYHTSREEAEQIEADIRLHGGEALAVKADVSRIEGCEKLFRTIEQEWGGVDIVVANAGIQRDAAFMEMTVEDWQRVLEVNLTGQFICAQGAVRSFRRQNFDPERSPARGKLIFTSSVHQLIPWPGHVNYAAAKGGLKLLMESMALELAEEKIRINAIAPGAIKTDINADVWQRAEGRKQMLELIPYGRIGEPEDVAKAAVWLASDESDYVVGTTLYVDGGMTLYPSFREAG